MASLALAFDIIARDKASKEFEKVGREARETGREVEQASDKGRRGMGGLAAAGGLLAGLGIGTFFKGAADEAREAEKITRLTENAIRATGGAANITSEQVASLAGSLSNKTAVDDELIQSGANLLLTFKNIRNEAGAGNDVFNQATAAALDLSAAGFGSVESASIMLGKALNDPIKGITALGRAGVTFTEQQKEQIRTLAESGDLLGAQSIILEEIRGQVGGAAAASADPIDRLKVAYGNLKETIGGAVLPILASFATFAVDTLLPALGRISGFVRDTFGPAFGRLKDIIGGLFDLFANGDFTGSLARALGVEEDSVVVNFLFTLRDTFIGVWDAIQSVFDGVVEAFRGDGIPGALRQLGENISDALPVIGDRLKDLGQAFVDWIGPYVRPMLEEAGKLLLALTRWVVMVALPAILEQLAKWAAAFVDWIGPKIPGLLRELGSFLSAATGWMFDTALPALLGKLAEWGAAFVAWVAPRVPDLLLELGKLLLDLVEWMVGTALPSIIAKLGEWAWAFVAWVAPRIPDLLLELGKLLGKLTEWVVVTALPAIILKLGEWGVAFVAWIGKAALKLPGALLGFVRDLGKWVVTEGVPALGRLGASMGTAILDELIEEIKKLPGRIRDAARSMGPALADAGRALGNKLLPGNPLGDGPGWAALGGVPGGGRVLAKVSSMLPAGLRVTSTYRSPAQNAAVGGSPTSYHLDRNNPAVDIAGPAHLLDRFYRQLLATGPWRELLWRVPGHFDHIHVAHEGGTVSATWPSLPGWASDERPVRAQVGEEIIARGGMNALIAEVAALRADIRSLPRDYQLGQRKALV